MMADRARVEEIMAEERELWDKERDILKMRIVELEMEVESLRKGPGGFISPPIGQRERIQNHTQAHNPLSFTSPGSNAVSVSGSIDGASRVVPQESGRNADGSPFYAPAPRNPSRTFEPTEVTDLRVDTMVAVRESPIHVTSKELTPSDFGIHSPPTTMSELETIPESVPESIDISHINPQLEGIPIKASAVTPAFAAHILSPQNRSPYHSPSKLSPNIKPPARPNNENHSPHKGERSLSPLSRDSNGKADIGALMVEPENKRLVMHAGHTPNHSITNLTALLNGSGSATPTQVNTESQVHAHVHRPQCAHFDGQDEALDEDVELSGPLGLTNDLSLDSSFLAQLTEKLNEAKKSEGVSPSSESTSSLRSNDSKRGRVPAQEDVEGPLLRLKPSINFGRPMGSM
jgi:hypothetical protein